MTRSNRRRLFAVVAVVAVLGAVLGLGWRSHGEAHPTLTLPDGTKLTVEGFTSGPRHALFLEPQLWTVIKKALPPRWHELTGPPRTPRLVADNEGKHLLWLSRWDPATGKYLSLNLDLKVQAMTPDGLLFDAAGSIGFGSNERGGHAALFKVLPWRTDTLRFRASIGPWQAEFDIPNPRRGERFPTWQADSLPGTNVVKGFQFIMAGLRSFGTSNQPFWMPQGEIAREGHPAGTWFSTHWTFEDPTGNSGHAGLPICEPTWKVRLTASPTADYPFPPDELFPIGRIEMPGPGEFRVLQGNADWTNAGLHALLLTGPGSFAFADGRNTRARPPGEGSTRNSFSWTGPSAWTFSTDCKEPKLTVIRTASHGGLRLMPPGEWSNILLVARRPDGQASSWTADNHLIASDSAGCRASCDSFTLNPLETHRVFDMSLVTTAGHVIATQWLVPSPYGR